MVDDTPRPRSKGLMIAAVLVIIVLLSWFWLFAPLGHKPEVGSSPVPQSTDWAQEPPGPAVPVDLPSTRMTNAPPPGATGGAGR